MKKVVRSEQYRLELDQIEARIATDNPSAAIDLWLHIDDQVAQLADPNFPRKIGRVSGTFELVVHPNYLVILEEDDKTILVLSVKHTRQKWPKSP